MTENLENSLSNFAKIFTSELPQRYGIKKWAVYDRLNALHIKPYRQGGRSCIDGGQLGLMDELHEHLKNGGKIDEFVQQAIADDRIIPPLETRVISQPVSQTELTVVQQPEVESTSEQLVAVVDTNEVEISVEASQYQPIAQLQAQKVAQVKTADMQEVAQRAQKRAFTKAAAEETLTLLYEATEEFTVPGLKEQLEQHRAACNQVRQQRSAAYNVNDFLSQALKTAMQKNG